MRMPSNFAKDEHEGMGHIVIANRNVLEDLIQAMQYFVYGYDNSVLYYKWSMLHYGLIDEQYELTWQDIVEVWIANDFEGRMVTIAVIDRMRQILWDEPYMVRWAARVEESEF